jgi:hypothetical protein
MQITAEKVTVFMVSKNTFQDVEKYPQNGSSQRQYG